MSGTIEAPGGRLGSIISELAQWASPDLINLSHAIIEMVERRGSAKQPSLKQIKEAVAAVAGVSIEELSSERRDRDVKRPRKVAIALCKHLTLAGYRRIGKAFERDLTAAQRACRQLEPLIAFAGKTVPPDASIGDWARLMLANYERIVGAD
ncbi:helix-turn-helix domain-containing protein [Bradyrhizobium sp. SZCCHNRI3042]|uniref:helix-turn-helix domain-containing protein n=1 Tax=Bradyrhizobium sp. SZCCHNRI3042 TaxID=3057291 RepID=UPI002916A452|nr:helix-turn-helix domain-containing protein [Bradyrhizobium sp. SZCCHNRI3042]